MSSKERIARIQDLREQIRQHDELYYRLATPKISDREYDRLKERLSELEKNPERIRRTAIPPIVASVAISMRGGGGFFLADVCCRSWSCGNRAAQHVLDHGHVDVARDECVAYGTGKDERDASVPHFFVVTHVSDQGDGIPFPVAFSGD